MTPKYIYENFQFSIITISQVKNRTNVASFENYKITHELYCEYFSYVFFPHVYCRNELDTKHLATQLHSLKLFDLFESDITRI